LEKIIVENIAIELSKTGQFSSLFLDYIGEKKELAPFFSLPPSLDSFRTQIALKGDGYAHRSVLCEVLKVQHAPLDLHDSQRANLDKLARSNCFTVTTGHQLALATGPLYFIYKILTTIKLAVKLKEAYPDQEFVPVFWMASEDHDFQEINHFHVFGKKYEWQREAQGAVGDLSLDGLGEVLDKVPDFPEWLKEAYTGSANLSEATRKIVQHLFGQYGLLIIDGHDKVLKSLIQPLIEKDLMKGAYAPVIKSSSSSLEDIGYKSQAFVREQNFFHLGKNLRARLEKQGDGYSLVQTDLSLSASQLAQRIQDIPEAFSPNVLMRPLYQETILPNLAYVGGPGELAYWLQLKDVFELENLPFPLLFPRNFVTLIATSVKQKLEEANIRLEDLFLEESAFHQLLLEKLNVQHFDFSEEEQLLDSLKKALIEKATKADKSLVLAAEAEIAKLSKPIMDFQKRLDKALENKHQQDIQKLHNIRKKLFPEGELQERHDNFLNFYINRPTFIEEVYQALDPFDFKMNCMTF
jgi:bacillithiol biosynthesis cysteine-adding enzyme BshC